MKWLQVWDLDPLGECCCLSSRCPRPGKHPWWIQRDGIPEGFAHGALAAVDLAVAEKYARAGNRLAAVPGDRVLVLDLDGDRAFRTFCRMARLVTREAFIGAARTPRGFHVWLRMVTDGWTQSAALAWMRNWLGRDMKGLDLRCGDRSYVVWPGGGDGRRWMSTGEWRQVVERAYVPGWDIGPGVLGVDNSWSPVWLAGEEHPQDVRAVQTRTASKGEIEVPAGLSESGLVGQEWAWERLELALERLGDMPPGSGRNNRLNQLAYFQGALCVWLGIAQEKVFSRLCAGGSDAGTHGVKATVESGLSAGLETLSGARR